MFTNKTPWVILLVLWMIGSTWWHVCKIKYLCTDDAPPVTVSNTLPVRMPSLIIADGDQFRLELPGNFSFAKSDPNANLNTLRGSLGPLANYLKTNKRTLEIIGYYTADEVNATSFANLGLARAEGVRQYLVQQGTPAALLTTRGDEKNDLTFTPAGDSLYGGLGIAFTGSSGVIAADSAQAVAADTATLTPAPAADTEPAVETIAAGITEDKLATAETYTSVFRPINLYFRLGEATYIKTPETTRFFEEAARYLATHKDKKLVITGYTDNAGPEEANRSLSRERAESVRAKLRQWHIKPEQLIVDAKGEEQPRASNDTREGRKANRRVVVVVQ